MKRIAVIGGGPAGMLAAAEAAGKGNQVILFEQNEKTGKKLYITGKGRCNLTNACPVEEMFEHIPRNPNFCTAPCMALPTGISWRWWSLWELS